MDAGYLAFMIDMLKQMLVVQAATIGALRSEIADLRRQLSRAER